MASSIKLMSVLNKTKTSQKWDVFLYLFHCFQRLVIASVYDWRQLGTVNSPLGGTGVSLVLLILPLGGVPTEPTKTGYTFGGWEVQTQNQGN